MLYEVITPDKMIVCCGIGAQGGEFGAAIRAGASYEIIGRAIYDAPDPRARVITSYSIHYTKLYERSSRSPSPR